MRNLERRFAAILLTAVLAVTTGCIDGTTISKPSTESGISEHEKAFRDNGSQARSMPHPSDLSPEEREKLAQKEKRLSGFKNMSIDGYRYRIYGDVGGPVFAEVERNIYAGGIAVPGDIVVYYTGYGRVVEKKDGIEVLNVDWASIRKGKVLHKTGENLTIEKMNAVSTKIQVSKEHVLVVLEHNPGGADY